MLKPVFHGWGSDRHKRFTIAVFVILASLDNTARGVFPPLYAIMARHFRVEEASLGFISAWTILVVAVTAVFWGYWGDRSSRKRPLLYGTLIWSLAMFLTGLSQTYTQLLIFQMIAAVGIGCIASLGFSVISDFIPPARRGLALSLWGIAQGGGGGAGAMLAGLWGAYNWPLPFFVVAGAGLLFACLYLFTFEPERGQSEPELASTFSSGKRYTYRIQWADLRQILIKRSNLWLMGEVFLATLASGALVWMPRLFIARVEANGYTLEVATMAGNLLSLLFQMGFYFAILAGHLGDRWQRRRPDGRAWFCTIVILASLPFMIGLFFMPFRGLELPVIGGVITVTLATLLAIVTNPWIAAAFILALVAVAFYSADNPNRSAMLAEVNLPEHRGTVVGLLTISTGLGLALGNALTGLSFDYFKELFPPPWNYALGLSLFQFILLPAAWCYYQLTKTVARDIAEVKQTLTRRAEMIL